MNQGSKLRLISIIVPVLNEADNVPLLWERISAVLNPLNGYHFEVVFVDDGSTDDTAQRVSRLPTSTSVGWKLVRLSRNFGHQAALSAGLKMADGEALVFLDADLQDPPELIPQFLDRFADGYDVVYGVRQNRKEPLPLRLCFGAFYRVFNRIAERPIPLDAGDFGLMSARVAKLIAAMPEQDRLVRGLRSWVGFRQIGIAYDRPERHAGHSGYRLGRRIEGALDGLFGFSKLPVRFGLFLGSFVVIAGLLYLLYIHASSLVMDTSVPGWKSLVTLGFMVAGANIVVTAIVGEYVSRIYFQGKERPLFIVDAIQEQPPGSDVGEQSIEGLAEHREK